MSPIPQKEEIIHIYPPTTTTVAAGLKLLKKHFPHTLPLHRRLQTGRFFTGAALLSNLNLSLSPTEEEDARGEWVMAYVDRRCSPETEVWISGSWDGHPSSSSSSGEVLLREVMRTIKTLGDGVVLCGAVNAHTTHHLQKLGLLTTAAPLVPNHHFTWDISLLPPPAPLPAGLEWGVLEGSQQLGLVRARTEIQRLERTLAGLPNLGIFPIEGGDPIAWAFVGLDASLTSLHVEEAWRGKGLAKALTTKLLREKMGYYFQGQGDDEVRLAHGYVIEGNRESEGMCRSLGGRSGTQVYWLRVDLDRV